MAHFDFLPQKKNRKRWSVTELSTIKKKFVSHFLISQDLISQDWIATLLMLSQIINQKSSANFDLNWKEVTQYNQNKKIVFFQKSRKMTKQHENVTFLKEK